MNKMIETILEVNSDRSICLFKIGSFYHCFGKDAYIMSYIFNYKIKEISRNNKECGFPIGALPKIKSKLENIGISYIVIDSRNNYYVDEQFDNRNNNQYQAIYAKAKRTVNYKIRIANINESLLENMERSEFSEILRKIEDIIYENREI